MTKWRNSSLCNKLSVTCGKYHVKSQLKCHSERVNIHSHAAFQPFEDEEDTLTTNSVYYWTNVSIATDLYLVYLRIKDCLNLEYRVKIYQKQFRYWSLHWFLILFIVLLFCWQTIWVFYSMLSKSSKHVEYVKAHFGQKLVYTQ
jgi:hypothetical protein